MIPHHVALWCDSHGACRPVIVARWIVTVGLGLGRNRSPEFTIVVGDSIQSIGFMVAIRASKSKAVKEHSIKLTPIVQNLICIGEFSDDLGFNHPDRSGTLNSN